ncbi:MAG: hypothetical protein PUD53_03520, partial [Oscillospiraceae bacterium]|nr:hypothetical protein [Oscillospiraceae bacterium]
VYAAEITVPESQNMLTLQFQVYDDTNWKHQILVVNSTVTPYSAYDGKIVVATANDKGEVKDYVADEETQATSESETQPTSESSEETQASSDEQTVTYGLHMSDGNGSNWKTNPMTVNGDVATVEMQLTAGTYEFKITDGTNWYGNNGTIADTTTTTSQHGWDMSANDGNCKLEATGGTYTFVYTISTSKLIITFVPAETQATTPSEETPTEPTPTEPTPTEPVASAYKVAGSFNDWGNSTDVMYYTSDDVVTVTFDIAAGTYGFKITDGTTWYGNNGTIVDTTTTTSQNGWDMSANDNDCTLKATGGSYTFTFNLTTKKLIIVKEA